MGSLLLGVSIALGAARLMATVVFGIGWADPLTLVVVVASLGGVAVAASYLPARRATRITPSAALRED